MSREMYPKQLLALVGNNSLLQDTVLRIGKGQHPILVCNEHHRFMVAEQVHATGAPKPQILLEPEGRNTAPAVALVAQRLVQAGDDAILVVLPSDHVITDLAAFNCALETAGDLAESGLLVTFGITPTAPETGYGYVQCAAPVSASAFKVARFVEKPDAETAQQYLAQGGYLWNSGMFVFKASVYLEELTRFRPDIADAVAKSCTDLEVDRDFVRINAEAFCACPSESIDYAVMEKTDRAVVVPLDAGWSDIGSWRALWEVTAKDDNHNAVRGDVILEDVTGSLIRAEHRLVSVLGLRDIVVIETADAVMIASQDESQNVKKLVSSLKSSGREERLTHRKVFRPWGFYENLDVGARYQVKRICVNPGASLSLQKHYHRAEHWTVVHGTAEVTCDSNVFQLTENQSTFIPLGSVHRLSNLGRIPLEIIEVQSGQYLGEDDIVRYEDAYGRSETKAKEK